MSALSSWQSLTAPHLRTLSIFCCSIFCLKLVTRPNARLDTEGRLLSPSRLCVRWVYRHLVPTLVKGTAHQETRVMFWINKKHHQRVNPSNPTTFWGSCWGSIPGTVHASQGLSHPQRRLFEKGSPVRFRLALTQFLCLPLPEVDSTSPIWLKWQELAANAKYANYTVVHSCGTRPSFQLSESYLPWTSANTDINLIKFNSYHLTQKAYGYNIMIIYFSTCKIIVPKSHLY